MANKKKVYKDDRDILSKVFDYGVYGVSPSTYIQAQKDLDVISSRAPADQEYATIFSENHPGFMTRMYRHLDPADSTVSYQSSGVDYYNDGMGGYMGKDYNELLEDRARYDRKQGRGSLTPQQAAMQLARYRASKL